ncbi:MAG: Xaa-Pro peptidase family protein [Rhodospirillaceae bacterium]|nr:Xaa-Pro peptidase family protein [Rhodospirillaceae bacterium]
MAPPFAAFAATEHRARLDAVRAKLRAAGIDIVISVAPEHHFYFGGYDSWTSAVSPQAMIFATSGSSEPTLVLRNTDRPLARESSWIEDIRTYKLHVDDVAALYAQVAQEKGLAGSGTVGIELGSSVLGHPMALAIGRALAPVKIVDANAILGAARVVKSPAEMTYMRKAATYAQAGLEAARKTAKPGVTEIALTAEIEAAMRRAGSDYWAITTELASGPRTPGGHGAARARRMQKGELVHAEFAGVEHRYHAVTLHSFALGDPGNRTRELYELCRVSLEEGERACKIGAPVAAVEEAALKPIRAAGLEDTFLMRFGYGIGIAYPPVWLEALEICRESSQIMQANTTFVLHSCIELEDEGIGIIQGGTYALTESGLELLTGGGAVPLEIL